MLKSAFILTSVVAGVLAGWLAGNTAYAIVMFALACAVRSLAAYGLRHDFTRYHLWTRLHSVWPCILLCGLGMLSAVWHLPYPADITPGTVCAISGTIKGRTTTTSGERYEVGVKSIVMPSGEAVGCRNLEVSLLASAATVLEAGDEIEYNSAIYPANHLRPGGGIYDTYDMIRVSEGGRTKSGAPRYRLISGSLRVTGHSDGILTLAGALRERMVILIGRSSLGHESAALASALLTGDRAGIRPARMSDIRDAGVAHALAVSGMHVGIVAVMLLWLTLPLNLAGGYRCRYAVALAGIWAFTLLTGLHYSTLRAAFMLTFASLGRITERKITPFAGLCMGASIILLLWPGSLWDVGFQLSFSCVAALALFMEPFNPINRHAHPVTFRLIEVVLATLIATGATWVITAGYFGNLPLNFLLSNLLMLPLLPAYMVAAMIYILLFAAGIDAVWLAWIMDSATDALYSFLSLCGSASVRLTPSSFTVALWTGGVAALACAVHRYRPEERVLPGAMKIPQRLTASGAVPLHRPSLLLAISLFASSVITLLS